MSSLFTRQQGIMTVPWGLGKVAQVMSLWLLAYILVGQVLFPIALSMLGLDRDYLTLRGHALLHLALDVCQVSSLTFNLY
jgi:hypothetical protein